MRQIVLMILQNSKLRYQSLADYLKLPHSTLSLYLKCLVESDVLAREKVGYENFYTVRNEDRVAKVLIAYKSSFLDKLVDKALNTWMETHFNKNQQEPR